MQLKITSKSFLFVLIIFAGLTAIYFFTNRQQASLLNQAPVKKQLSKKTETDEQDGPALFAEYHNLIRTREGEASPAYEPNYRLKAYRNAILKRPKNLRRESLPWIERGPGNVSGRTRGVWIDPTDELYLTWYVGSVGGGIWKTEDGGVSWRHLTEDLTNLGTSAIMGAKANPDVLYAGTGEGFAGSNIGGNGIWKSTDRGENWAPLESTLNDPRFVHIMRIAVNPEDEQEMVVATRVSRRITTEEGDILGYIFKSSDGGLSWEQSMATTSVAQHLIAHPQNFDTLYAGVNSAAIMRSVDGGASWDSLFKVADLGITRMEIAISPNSPNVLYFSGYTRQGGSVLYRSDNSGMDWYEVRGTNNRNQLRNWLGGQGWYNNTIAVHPFDPNIVFVGGQSVILRITVTEFEPDEENLLKAIILPVSDGYAQYAQFFNTSSKGVHVDHHNLVLIPIDSVSNEFYIVNANDGGIAFSTDSGNSFVQTGDAFNDDGFYETNKGYNTAQFYGVDKMNGADRYVGGTQDNGSWVSPVDPDADSDWVSAPSGDGFEAAWHYQDPNKVLESSQFNNIYRSDDGGQSWRSVSPPGRGPFISRIANSKIDPELVFAVSDEGVVRSVDFADSWDVIQMPDEWRFSGAAQVRVSLATSLVVWSGSGITENTRLTVSKDGGVTFTATNGYEPADLGAISGLATHPVNQETAYALFSISDGPKVMRTNDLGENWEDISGFVTNAEESTNGFPDVATYTLLVMPFDTNRIWVGTEIGLFESLDDGQNWHYADNGMPPASIWEMKIVNDEVVLATHGRGIWTVSLPELETYEPAEPIAFLPLLNLQGGGLGGKIKGGYNFRSVYDSAFLEMGITEGETLTNVNRIELEPNTEPVQRAFDLIVEGLPEDTIISAKISVLAYKNGIELVDRKEVMVYKVEEQALTEYQTDFDDGKTDFARLGFNIYQETGFDDQALHSPHPYLGFYQTYTAVLQYPIVVSASNPMVSFDEIAMIEPGEDGTVFGDFEFWDYVLVEGTRDRGLSWQTIEGYDVRFSENWEDSYDQNATTVDPDLLENHMIDLTTVFEPGDTIFLRFVLQSDPYVEGWGWVIDNLQIQGNPTSSDDQPLPVTTKISTYPNPTSGLINLNFSLAERQNVRIQLYTVSGQQLAILEQGVKQSGEHQLRFDATKLEAGMYLFRIETGKWRKTIRWVKLE